MPMLLGKVHQQPDQRLHKGRRDELQNPRALKEVVEYTPRLHVQGHRETGQRCEGVEEEIVEGIGGGVSHGVVVGGVSLLLKGGVKDVVQSGSLEAVTGGLLQFESLQAETEVSIPLLQHLEICIGIPTYVNVKYINAAV